MPCPLAPRRAAAAQGQQAGRDTLTVGITQYPSTLHPNIESMAAKSYVLGFARRPVTAYDADWRLTCLLCEELPSLENGLAVRETTPDGRPGIRVTWRLREGLRWGDGQPVTSADILFAWEAGRNFETGFGGAEFFRSAYEATAPDARSVTIRFDRVTLRLRRARRPRAARAHRAAALAGRPAQLPHAHRL
jgi:peptide/nickel transport system substrate-binding protein